MVVAIELDAKMKLISLTTKSYGHMATDQPTTI